jgi:hypothetical protein
VIHSEVVTVRPWIDITITTGAVFKILEEHLRDSDGAFTVQRKLTISFQELVRVLLDERGIINAPLEGIISENALKELDISGEANNLIISKSFLQSVNSMLS